MMTKTNGITMVAMLTAALALSVLTGCAHRQPTIAHVHVGHALTGAHDTPTKKGYFVIAEMRAEEALKYAEQAGKEDTLAGIQVNIDRVVELSDSEEHFGVRHALSEAGHHLNYAATSADASENIKQSVEGFNRDMDAVLERCDLIRVLGNDVRAATVREEGEVLAHEILLLVRANYFGEDANGDGVVGSTPAGYGLVQLRKELQVVVDREDPPYQPVDRWYLFNLVRLPSGEWVFQQFGGYGY